MYYRDNCSKQLSITTAMSPERFRLLVVKLAALVDVLISLNVFV
jgi:hypothetical protein